MSVLWGGNGRALGGSAEWALGGGPWEEALTSISFFLLSVRTPRQDFVLCILSCFNADSMIIKYNVVLKSSHHWGHWWYWLGQLKQIIVLLLTAIKSVSATSGRMLAKKSNNSRLGSLPIEPQFQQYNLYRSVLSPFLYPCRGRRFRTVLLIKLPLASSYNRQLGLFGTKYTTEGCAAFKIF